MTAHPFLVGLSDEQVNALSSITHPRQFAAGETIFRQRAAADGFYLLRQGNVKLDYELPGHLGTEIQQLGAGELLGLSWLFPPYKWQFTATALDVVEADFFSAVDVRAECERDAKLGYTLMERIAKTLTDRLQATRHKLLVYVARTSADPETQQVC